MLIFFLVSMILKIRVSFILFGLFFDNFSLYISNSYAHRGEKLKQN